MQQKLYFKIFLPQETGAFGKNIEKELQKPRHTEKLCLLCIYREYLLYLQSNASGSFLQKCIYFEEQRLKFSHFKDSIIP